MRLQGVQGSHEDFRPERALGMVLRVAVGYHLSNLRPGRKPTQRTEGSCLKGKVCAALNGNYGL
jgi:hypothetical protein